MAEFNRSRSIPIQLRRPPRPVHASCPRCRPARPERPLWDPANSLPISQETRRSNRAPNQASSRYYTSSLNGSGVIRYSGDNHSGRSSGDTWRIRGVLENHPPGVPRRAESSTGRLPDITHTQTVDPTSIQHVRTRSVPVGGAYDSRLPQSNSYDIHLEQQSQLVSRSLTQNVICSRSQQDGLPHPTLQCTTVDATRQPEVDVPMVPPRSSAPRSEPLCHGKRDQVQSTNCKVTNSSPWVTRNVQIERQPTTEAPSQSNSLGWSNHNQQQPSTSCWRPSTVPPPSQNVLTQCPLPDLVTPRRQARKQCCGLLATHSVAIRWLVVVIAALGLVCSIVGTIVGVVKATGREHLTVALLLIGLGIVLVSMSGVAWRLTSRDSPSCRAMFGLRRTRHEPHRRFVPRVPHYGRPHPFSAMLYPDITLRPPPPSYQASMQEYRLRLLLMDRQTTAVSHPPPSQPPPPPPPVYRGPATVYPRFPVNISGMSDYSRPPSYRSRPSSSAGQPSPVGPDDVELINNMATSSSHLADDVIPSLTDATSQQRAAPSMSTSINHVEVVAQV